MQYPDEPGDRSPADASQPLPPYSTYRVPGANRPPRQRPGTVTGAAVITIVMSSISIVCGIIAIIASTPLVNYMTEHPGNFDLNPQDVENPGNLTFSFIALSVLLVIFAIIAILFAVFVLKRHQWARVILTVLAAVTILCGAVGSVMIIGAPWLITGIIVVILLYTGGANTWFAFEDARDMRY